LLKACDRILPMMISTYSQQCSLCSATLVFWIVLKLISSSSARPSLPITRISAKNQVWAAIHRIVKING